MIKSSAPKATAKPAPAAKAAATPPAPKVLSQEYAASIYEKRRAASTSRG